jgi:FAD/FMN-containing dehydrogenase
LVELTVVKADGESVKVTGDDISKFVGSYGILGIVAEAKIRIRKSPARYVTMAFAFERIKDMMTAIEMILVEQKPTYLKIADKEFQSFSNPLKEGKYILTMTYEERDDPLKLDDIMNIASSKGGMHLGEEYSEKEWDLRYDCEFNPKEHCETLMFQELSVKIEDVATILERYEAYKKSHKVPAIWYAMLGNSEWMRVEVLAMIDAEQYLKFISSKGILHKMMKKTINLGGGPYQVGLQNSIYMKRAYPERLEEMRAAKESWDPQNIMNPDRITSCMTSYARMDVLFVMAAAIRRVARYFGRS